MKQQPTYYFYAEWIRNTETGATWGDDN